MDMLQVFHMNKGQGEASYAKNSTVQNKILSLTKPFVEEAIQGYFSNDFPDTMVIADLGCSSGPTALEAISKIIDSVNAICQKKAPKFMVFLNDLPGNDFNGVFASVPNFHKKLKEDKGDDDFGPCFIAGLPGSFYGRLLPTNTLHFVYSSSSLHWLSQAPPGLDGKDNPTMQNKGKIYISKTSSSEVVNAYKLQFQKDFLSFLKCRAEEIISGGRMVLALMSRKSTDPTTEEGCFPWEFLAHCLMSMVSEGLVEEEKVNSCNLPYYAPCLEELKQLVDKESSFCGHRFGAVEVELDGGTRVSKDELTSCGAFTKGERIAKMVRAVIESLLKHHFGGDIMDELFLRFGRVVDDHLKYNANSKVFYSVLSLVKL